MHRCLLVCTPETGPLLGPICALAYALAPGTYRALAMSGGDVTCVLFAVITRDLYYTVEIREVVPS